MEKVTKTIDTLVEDLQNVLVRGVSRDVCDPGRLNLLGSVISDAVRDALDQDLRKREPTLRMSNIGKPCNRALWYELNGEEKEELSASTRMKFLFGHILEEIVLYLVEVSGHSVQGRQDEQEIEGIKGHRDAVIDGVVVDVKSASTYSFKKFEEHKVAEDDAFGYIDQLQSYLHCGSTDDKVTDKDRAAFLVVDKTLGNICLDIHKKKQFPIEKLYQYKKELVRREEAPNRGFDPIPEGKSGNMKLGVNCSYCDFKNKCHPGLRTFLYSNKPVFLTKVVREPNVQEAK